MNKLIDSIGEDQCLEASRRETRDWCCCQQKNFVLLIVGFDGNSILKMQMWIIVSSSSLELALCWERFLNWKKINNVTTLKELVYWNSKQYLKHLHSPLFLTDKLKSVSNPLIYWKHTTGLVITSCTFYLCSSTTFNAFYALYRFWL